MLKDLSSVTTLPTDVSRGGEYSKLRFLLGASTPRIVVDVGAFGKAASNSWNFICEDGWKGLLIDPRPGAVKRCHEEFDGDFEVIQKAICDFEGEAPLFRYSIPGWSTLDPDAAAKIRTPPGGKPVGTRPPIQVAVTTLPKVLEEYGIPKRFGVLSVDTEGCDARVVGPLCETDWRPDLIINECDLRSILSGCGYTLVHSQKVQQIWRTEELMT